MTTYDSHYPAVVARLHSYDPVQQAETKPDGRWSLATMWHRHC